MDNPSYRIICIREGTIYTLCDGGQMAVFPSLGNVYFEASSEWVADIILEQARIDHSDDDLAVMQWRPNVQEPEPRPPTERGVRAE